MAEAKQPEQIEMRMDRIFPDVDRVYTPEELQAAIADLASLEDRQALEEPAALDPKQLS